MASLREIKSRIKAVKSTAKITKAMQMISASRMVKAQMRSNSATPYANALGEVFNELNIPSEYQNPYFDNRSVKAIAIVIIGPSRGFVGGMISSLKIKVAEYISEVKDQNIKFHAITLHKEGLRIAEQLNMSVDYHFAKFIDQPVSGDVSSTKRVMLQGFASCKYDKVVIAYTHFINIVLQEPRIIDILPLQANRDDTNIQNKKKFIFEPNVNTILDTLIPEYIENQLYAALLNSIASEYSARMVAMKNATDNANELNEKLSLHFNRTRQANITKEISEIVSASRSKRKNN